MFFFFFIRPVFYRVVKEVVSQTIQNQKHPSIHQSVCPYKDELNPTPQDARIFVFDAAPRSIFAPDGAFRDDAPRAQRPETDAYNFHARIPAEFRTDRVAQTPQRALQRDAGNSSFADIAAR